MASVSLKLAGSSQPFNLDPSTGSHIDWPLPLSRNFPVPCLPGALLSWCLPASLCFPGSSAQAHAPSLSPNGGVSQGSVQNVSLLSLDSLRCPLHNYHPATGELSPRCSSQLRPDTWLPTQLLFGHLRSPASHQGPPLPCHTVHFQGKLSQYMAPASTHFHSQGSSWHLSANASASPVLTTLHVCLPSSIPAHSSSPPTHTHPAMPSA